MIQKGTAVWQINEDFLEKQKSKTIEQYHTTKSIEPFSFVCIQVYTCMLSIQGEKHATSA